MVDTAFAEIMPILSWLALRASEMLGFTSFSPTYTWWGFVTPAATPPLTDLIPDT
jgi:hypothetical protein